MKVLWLSKDSAIDEGVIIDKNALGYFVFSEAGVYMAGPYTDRNLALCMLEFFLLLERLKNFQSQSGLLDAAERLKKEMVSCCDKDVLDYLKSSEDFDAYGCNAEENGMVVQIIGKLDFRNIPEEVICSLYANAKAEHFPLADHITTIPEPSI